MMTRVEFVDGDGWISDESSFYGDEDVRASLELEAGRELRLPHFPFAHITAKRSKSTLASQPRQRGELNYNSDASTTENTAPPQAKRETKVAQDTKKSVQISNFAEVADFLQSDRLQDLSASWQYDEAVSDFLERHPVTDPKTARVGPWLWVRNPELSESLSAHVRAENIVAFKDQATRLLHDFIEQRSKEDGDNASRAKLTRPMRIRRDKLEEDLLAAAVRTGTTCGKWMLFPGPENLDKYWRIVAEGTAAGRFGPVSKVATPDASSDKDETLICIYTYDFSDLKDVRRVLNGLHDCGLCAQGGKPIYYKCDGYTYLDITSKNSYDLRASLFSSREVFGNEARILDAGPIARVKKRLGQTLASAH